MIDILFWIIFGSLIGWLAAAFSRDRSSQQTMYSMLFGVCGAVLGGFTARLMAGTINQYNPSSLLMAVVGALCLAGSFHSIRRRI